MTGASKSAQQAVLTLVDSDSPNQAYAKFINLDKAGTTVELDAETGLDLSGDASYLVSLEHAGGGKITLEELKVDGADMVSGGAQSLEAAGGENPLAFSAFADGADHPLVDSSDDAFNVVSSGGSKGVLNGTGDSDLLIDGGGKASLLAGGGDDILVFDAGAAMMDGGAGIDILRIDDGARKLSQDDDLDSVTVDLSAKKLDGKIDGVEVILLTEESQASADKGTKLKLSLSDLVDITGQDDDPLLTILGNAGDSVDLSGGAWTQQADADGFHVFTSDIVGGGVATVKIDADIQSTDIAVG